MAEAAGLINFGCLDHLQTQGAHRVLGLSCSQEVRDISMYLSTLTTLIYPAQVPRSQATSNTNFSMGYQRKQIARNPNQLSQPSLTFVLPYLPN